MPVEKLTPSQAEAIRINGRCPETDIHAAWGYHPKAGAKLFYLARNERLPTGWFDSPAKFPAPKE